MAARSDHGLFGPDSVTWRVHGHPAMLVGGLRALIVQALNPLALAGVVEHSDFRDRPLHRFQRTAAYVSTVTFGTRAQAEAAGATVRRVHGFINGVDVVTGRDYSATDPATLLWVHCVEVHSFLAAYRVYGGRLSATEQDTYLAESARSAELVGIQAAAVPGTVADMRDYWASMLPTLCVSASTRRAIDFVLTPPLTGDMLAVAPALRVTALAAVGLIPRHLRRIAGIDRPRLADATTYAAVAPALTLLATAMRLPYVEAVGNSALRRLRAAA